MMFKKSLLSACARMHNFSKAYHLAKFKQLLWDQQRHIPNTKTTLYQTGVVLPGAHQGISKKIKKKKIIFNCGKNIFPCVILGLF